MGMHQDFEYVTKAPNVPLGWYKLHPKTIREKGDMFYCSEYWSFTSMIGQPVGTDMFLIRARDKVNPPDPNKGFNHTFNQNSLAPSSVFDNAPTQSVSDR